MGTEGCKSGRIPLATVRRLASYFNCLRRLRQRGVQHVASHQLAEQIGIKPSQVRHDLYYFGEFGQRGYGYHVAHLEQELAKILHVEHELAILFTRLRCARAFFGGVLRI